MVVSLVLTQFWVSIQRKVEMLANVMRVAVLLLVAGGILVMLGVREMNKDGGTTKLLGIGMLTTCVAGVAIILAAVLAIMGSM